MKLDTEILIEVQLKPILANLMHGFDINQKKRGPVWGSLIQNFHFEKDICTTTV
jgi:hypothetical protein